MAVSTTVFAPSVKAVQPAFIYNTKDHTGEVEVYFSLSSYNNREEVKGLKYTIIDPNIKGGSSSSMLLDSAAAAEVEIQFVENSQKDCYFTIDCSNLKELKLNQYYQVQIYLLDQILYEEDGITEKERIYSAPSQATLIRPIDIPQFNSDVFNTEETEIEVNDLKTISGSISYPLGSTKEYLAKYKIDVQEVFTNSKTSKLVYTTGWIYNTNGLAFSTKISYSFSEYSEYKILFTGETVNGYIIEKEKELIIKGPKGSEWEDFNIYENERKTKLRISNDINSGAVKMIVNFDLFDGSILVQRSDSDSNFNTWENVVKINITTNDVGLRNGLSIYDYLVKGDNTIYQYRFIKTKINKNTNEIVATYIATNDNYRIESSFEDIFLSNTDKQLAIKYNPNISGFKWVVQESITNTLGGKYPLIRRNGDTKYRQFTLNGTLYFDPLLLAAADNDSTNQSMETWLPDNSSSLFISNSEALGGAWDSNTWNNRSYKSKLELYEQRFKDAAMSFLVDGKPKLFRSPTEGYMLVMLTNISFTPNKQLGRRMVDFSATVTEFAEPTPENFIRYGIDSEIEYSYYVLVANKIATDPNNGLIVTPYLSENVIVNNDNRTDEYMIRLIERMVRF